MRSGRWWRQLVVVPHQRTQSMALHQGPLARRFGVADLVLHTTAGPVTPRVIQAGVDEARELFDQQAARARAARRRQTSEQWLAQVAPLVGQPPLVGPPHQPPKLASSPREPGWRGPAETDPAPHQPQQEGPQRG
jgi:putative membrane protein